MASGEEETVVRNGTLWNWLTYTIVFGGKPDKLAAPYDPYKLVGGKRVKAYWLVLALVLVAVVGWWV